MSNWVFTVTDFGTEDHYLGLMEAALLQYNPALKVISLFSRLDGFNLHHASILLRSLPPYLPKPSFVLGVVDPGVGGARKELVIKADGCCWVGPDNGLFSQVVKQADEVEVFVVDEAFPKASSCFHGRDIFAPVIGRLSLGEPVALTPYAKEQLVGVEWPGHCFEIVYQDKYGNLMTGLSEAEFPDYKSILICDFRIERGVTFASVPVGAAFCYTNSIGLIEIAVNQGNAAHRLKVGVGETVKLEQ